MRKILCIVEGGLGDEVLALPAIRYLKQNLPADQIEIRLGGWTTRRKLFELLSGWRIRTLSLEELYATPFRPGSSRLYDWILRLDIRTLPGKLPPWLQAVEGLFSFAEAEAHQNAIIIQSGDTLYWQHCFEMAFRLVCVLKKRPFSRSAMLHCRDEYRQSRIGRVPLESRKRVHGWLKICNPRARCLAVTPGGYNPPYKTWAIERFAEVIWHAVMRGINVFVLGSQRELPLSRKLYRLILEAAKEWRRKASGDVSFLTGKVPLQELPIILAQMDLHLTNDNGVAQIAGALDRPQIVLYRGTDSPHRTPGSHDRVLFSGDELRMEGISTAQVISIFDDILPPKFPARNERLVSGVHTQ